MLTPEIWLRTRYRDIRMMLGSMKLSLRYAIGVIERPISGCATYDDGIVGTEVSGDERRIFVVAP